MGKLKFPLLLPLILFLISALVGVWASYDPATSWRKIALIAFGIALYFFVVGVLGNAAPRRLAQSGERMEPNAALTALVWLLLGGSVALAVLFVTQNDFLSHPAKLEILTRSGILLHSLFPLALALVPDRNVIVGVLAIALPVGLGLTWHVWTQRKIFEFAASLGLVMVIAFGLVLASSVRAWLALFAVLGAAALIYFGAARWENLRTQRGWLAVAGIVLLLFVFGIAFLSSNPWLGNLLAEDRVGAQTALNDQTWQLIQDYPFTGAGLGVFTMILSTYGLALRVPFIEHANSTFLQVWIEQGILGIVAFVWLWLEFYFWMWQRRAGWNWLATGACLAATVLLVNDLFDVRLYATNALPLMFMPFALAVAAARPVPARNPEWDMPRVQFACGGIAAAASALLLFSFGNPAAQWYANLGSVAQTRVELSRYHFPEMLVEYVRRSQDLSFAEILFRETLALDPDNATANQRLGAIQLARGQYERAKNYLELAYRARPEHPAAIQLLGDAYLALGRHEDAYTLWAQVPEAEEKLQADGWIYFKTVGDDVRTGWAWELAARLGKERAAAP